MYFIPEHPSAKEALEKYKKLKSSLDNFIAGTCFSNWNKDVDSMDSKNIDGKLENQILVRAENSNVSLPPSLNSNPLF